MFNPTEQEVYEAQQTTNQPIGIVVVDCATCNHCRVCSYKPYLVKHTTDILTVSKSLPNFMKVEVTCKEYSKIQIMQFRGEGVK